MKTNYHLLFYVLVSLVLAQTTVIAFCFSKFSTPINTHLLTELNESAAWQKQNLIIANEMAFQFFDDKVRKQKRGHVYLNVANGVKELALQQVDSLETLLQMPESKQQEMTKDADKQLSFFYENLNTILNRDGKTDKVDLDILNIGINQYKDSLQMSDLRVNNAILKQFIRRKQVDILALSENIVHHFSSKVGFVGILYDKFRVALIPESTVLELGETFRTKVYLAKAGSMARPSIIVNGKGLSLDKNGMATYKTIAKTLGTHKIEGFIKFRNGDGSRKSTLPFAVDYEVVKKCN
ncbi:MAG: hypothetical protein ACPG5B_10980 [Chitinophagales bacterium]